MTGYIIPDDWDESSYKCYEIQWPDSEMWGELLRGALSGFTFPWVWDSATGDADEAATIAQSLVELNNPDNLFPPPCEGNGLLAGEIKYHVGGLNFSDYDFRICDGSLLETGCELRDLLISDGYPFGQASGSPFLPNLVARFPMGTIESAGNTGGASTVTLTAAQMPAHSHYVTNALAGGVAGSNFDFMQFLQGTGDYYGVRYTDSQGNGQPHENLPPYLKLIPIIYLGEVY